MHYTKLIIFLLSTMIFAQTSIAAEESAAPVTKKVKETKEVKYYDASFKNMSQTYWRLSKFDIKDDVAVDNFMKINECDLYNEFRHNEFEWKSVREAGRKYLTDNKKSFPFRYEYSQAISLDEYDFEKGGFYVAKEHAYDAVKRIEFATDALYQDVCEDKYPVLGYPKAIALELTRPFNLSFVKIHPNRAKALITEKMKRYENMEAIHKTRENYLKNREVFLFMKVKMFVYKPEDKSSGQGYYLANILGTLEGFEIYADKERTQLLYEVNYNKRKRQAE